MIHPRTGRTPGRRLGHFTLKGHQRIPKFLGGLVVGESHLNPEQGIHARQSGAALPSKLHLLVPQQQRLKKDMQSTLLFILTPQ